MRFTCEKSILSDMINQTGRAVSSKSTIPALEGILIQAEENLTLTGFDLEVGIRTSSAASIEEKGSVVINARILSDTARPIILKADVMVVDRNHAIERNGVFQKFGI